MACQSTVSTPAGSQVDATWQPYLLPTKRETRYVPGVIDGRPVIQADADNAVSLYRRAMRIEPRDLGRLSFSWMVPQLIAAADLKHQHMEDAPVRLVLAFDGDHSKLSFKNRVLFDLMEAVMGEEPPYATLMYVWDNRAPVESVIHAGRTDRIRKIVVDSGPTQTSVWRFHERDIASDYRRAFGEDPGPLTSVALMTDSDNTRSCGAGVLRRGEIHRPRPRRRTLKAGGAPARQNRRFPPGLVRRRIAAMLVFIVRRIAQAVLVMLTVALVSFALFQFVGDPVTNLLGQDATPQQREQLRRDLGLDQSVPAQFARFVGNAVQGEFGLSLRQGRQVSALIAERLPATLELSLVAAVLALALGIPLGVYAALRRGRWGAQLLMAASLIGVSLPTFLIGIGLILVFSVTLNWLPSFGRGEVVQLGPWSTGLLTADGWRHLLLPSITLAIFQLTLIMRLVRAEMIEVLRTDYIRFARARGLTNRSIYFGHALKNTLVPVITITGLQLGSLIAFAIITETVFQWPGMGLLFIQAVQFADIPVMAAYLCLIALIFVVINLAVDLLYFAVDPRLRVERAADAR